MSELPTIAFYVWSISPNGEVSPTAARYHTEAAAKRVARHYATSCRRAHYVTSGPDRLTPEQVVMSREAVKRAHANAKEAPHV